MSSDSSSQRSWAVSTGEYFKVDFAAEIDAIMNGALRWSVLSDAWKNVPGAIVDTLQVEHIIHRNNRGNQKYLNNRNFGPKSKF